MVVIESQNPIKKDILNESDPGLSFTTCNSGEPDLVDIDKEAASQTADAIKPTQFDGVKEVYERTGNEDGSNEPVCGFETAAGTATINDSNISGEITNKSGFEYTVEGTIDNSGKVKAMLIYSGYDVAELIGTFSAETNKAKGYWKDAGNADNHPSSRHLLPPAIFYLPPSFTSR